MALGFVKWFKGFNRKTGKENDYGFLAPLDGGDDIFVHESVVPSQFLKLLQPGTYVEFEVSDRGRGKSSAEWVKPVSLVGVVDWFNGGRGYIKCEDIADVRVETWEELRSNDVVFFYLKQNLKYEQDEAIAPRKITVSTVDEEAIEKCANSSLSILSAQFMVRYASTLPTEAAIKFILDKGAKLDSQNRWVVSNNLISEAENLLLASSSLRQFVKLAQRRSASRHSSLATYCQFLNKYINSESCILDGELLDETLDDLERGDDRLQALYWKCTSILKENRAIVKKCANSDRADVFQRFLAEYATTLPVETAIKFVTDKMAKLINESDRQTVAYALLRQTEEVFLASPELRQSLKITEESPSWEENKISLYCQFVNKYIQPEGQPINQELLTETLADLDRADDYIRSQYWEHISVFKETVEYKGKFWSVAPQEVKRDLIKKRYRRFFDLVFEFEDSEYQYASSLSCSWQELYQFDEIDLALVKAWCSDSIKDLFIKGKMISARGAEKLAMGFYKSLGYKVEDVSAYQVSGRDETWIKGDIYLNSRILLDIKNARTLVNSGNSYSEFCIPAFKKERGEDITLVGVLSPYLKIELTKGEDKPDFSVEFPYVKKKFIEGEQVPSISLENPIVLGTFNKSKLSKLEKLSSHRLTSIIMPREKEANTYLPPWVFDYNQRFYEQQRKIIDSFRELKLSEIPEWEEVLLCEINPLPLLIAAKTNLPHTWVAAFPQWKVEFVRSLIDLRMKYISLPYLFLTVLVHFLDMLSSENKNYSPSQYLDILYASYNRYRPLKIYDPLNIITDFCSTLQTLWENRTKANLQRFKIFKFNGKGLLQGQESPDDRPVTILAHCGGWIEGKGKCGYRPLVIGQHKTCTHCGRLICPQDNCGFCSQGCEGYHRRKGRPKKDDLRDREESSDPF